MCELLSFINIDLKVYVHRSLRFILPIKSEIILESVCREEGKKKEKPTPMEISQSFRSHSFLNQCFHLGVKLHGIKSEQFFLLTKCINKSIFLRLLPIRL